MLWAEGKISQCDRLWCVGVLDLDTREKFYWGVDLGPDSIEYGMRFLSKVDRCIAHNGIGYDYPQMEKLYPESFKRPRQAWDSMVIAKVIWPPDALFGPDLARARAGTFPMKLVKRHSLEAWGHRTGTHKVEYSGGFDAWRPAMASYLMTGDLDGPEALWRLIEKRLGWAPDTPEGALVWPERVISDENKVAEIIQEQQAFGIRFDQEKAVKLSSELLNTKAGIETQLIETFGSWWQPGEVTTPARSMQRALPQFPDVTIRRVSEKTGKELRPYVGPPLEEFQEGCPYTPITWTTFNPGSRDHLGMRLQAVFGWKPKAFGKDGKPTVDESTLAEIPEAVMPKETRQLILDYFVVSKTLGMLSKGAKSWMGLCSKHSEKHGTESRIHGSMDTCGAVTRRGIHKDPNLSQVPSVRKEKVVLEDGSKVEKALHGLKGRYGYECKELMTADPGWELTDCDASSLELIDLGHYLFLLDGGKFSARVCDPDRDPHQEHADLADMTRGDAKTTIYLKVYGGSAFKLSLSLDVSEDEIPSLLAYRGLPMLLKSVEKRFDADFVAKLDDRQRAKIAKARIIIVKLEAGIEGLADLIKSVQEAAKRGWLKALDGSRIHVRKPHAALNSLLQSAGAITCKRWMVRVHEEMERRGYVKGRDWKQVLWVHDALTFTHKPGLGPVLREVCEWAMQKAGEDLNLRGTYRTSGHTGRNWAEVH